MVRTTRRSPFRPPLPGSPRGGAVIERVDMFRVLCDGCGRAVDADFYAWTEAAHAIDEARDSEWLITDEGGHFCFDCQTWDEEQDCSIPVVRAPQETG